MTQPSFAGLVAGLDHSIRPQDDLFRHVNNTWMDANDIPADKPRTGTFDMLRDQAELDARALVEAEVARAHALTEPDADPEEKRAFEGTDAHKIALFYESFMDEDRIEGIGASALDDDFAIIDEATDRAALDLAVGRLMATNVSAPFAWTVESNPDTPTQYITWLAQDGLGLPDEAYYRSEEYAEYLEKYENFIPLLYSLATGENDAVSKDAARDILNFEKAIAAHHMTVVEARDADKTHNIIAWDAFIDSAPGFDWATVLDALGLNAEIAPEFMVMNPDALRGFAAEWAKAELSVLKTYLRWQVILSRARYLNKDIVQAHFNFYGKTLSGVEEMRDRWKRGLDFVDGAIGFAVGKLFVDTHFPPRSKEIMGQLVADLLEAYRQSISALDWMTDETREKALAKLSTFRTKIGYPDSWRDYSALEASDSLMSNVRNIARFEINRQFAKLGGPIDRDEWLMTPHTVNAYYHPLVNEIVFPAAILRPPFFDPDADAALNYGAIGAVIGHEIGHGFDDQGSKYDGDGRLNNWWTDADRSEFEKRTGNLVSQYNAYIPAQLGPDSPHHVNGELTLGENIGDLGGLSIALKAYDIAMKRDGHASAAQADVIDGYTGIQRVFLSWAQAWQSKVRDEYAIQMLAIDPHSPAEFRCNGVVKNIDAFAEAFDVHEGDALYLAPEQRVRIW
ncbi:M13 family metallopeptidase [Trueperella sp. LYQ143]|uniref:M13 family metallopeptidase n=1 Tax=unclassified Trueperella TaxID=2630174 RepID=UPI003982F4E3